MGNVEFICTWLCNKETHFKLTEEKKHAFYFEVTLVGNCTAIGYSCYYGTQAEQHNSWACKKSLINFFFAFFVYKFFRSLFLKLVKLSTFTFIGQPVYRANHRATGVLVVGTNWQKALNNERDFLIFPIDLPKWFCSVKRRKSIFVPMNFVFCFV